AELADDPTFLARFRQEVGAASRVAGFCTARVLDARLEAEHPWFVTEYVDGPTLSDAVARDGPLAGPRLSTFAIGVAEALDAIHAAGVVHRDLKPSNVLLARSAPKVIDFGIARVRDAASLTQTGKLIGTVNWLAPERFRHDRASPLSDVFAWGGLVAFAATGRPPFGSGPPEAIVHRILHEPPDLGGLDGELRGAVEAALDKDPGRRPSTRALLARLLGTGVQGGEAPAAATRVVQRTWKSAPVRPVGGTPVRQAGGTPVRPGAPPAPAWPAPARNGTHDLLLVLGFAGLLAATADALQPGWLHRGTVPLPLLLALGGAALLGAGRSLSGLALGLLLPDLLLRNASGRPLHLAMYGLVALTMAIVGRLAGHGRRWRPLRAVAALAAGYVLLYVLLRAGLAAAVVLTRDLGAAVPFP
ncbi:MAG TPA: serine/threonine-protein kinase, partial [Actinomycetota bacterium]|nr:serine/threonine-protein kinase [Actinomycetota bacterium]